ELGTIEQLSLQLIGEEYWARVRWGDRPNHEHYAARFPQYGAKLRDALLRIDAELAAEFKGNNAPELFLANGPALPRVVHAGPTQPVAAVADLVEILRHCQLLSPTQLDELTRDLSQRFASPHSLAKELVHRDWLTPYQVNQLFLGKA